MDNCIFCSIVKGEIPSKKVFEDEDILAFYDINPTAPVHVLIIPKKHISKLADVGEEDVSLLGRIQLTAKLLAQELKIEDGFRLSTLNGEKAGQMVFHLHYHLMGGWKNRDEGLKSVKTGKTGV